MERSDPSRGYQRNFRSMDVSQEFFVEVLGLNTAKDRNAYFHGRPAPLPRLYQTAYPVKSRLMTFEIETLPVLSNK